MALVDSLGDALNCQNPPLSIEFLPGDTDVWLASGTRTQNDFLLQENHLGIPQETVYKAYMQAVSVFQSYQPHKRLLLGGQGFDGATIQKLKNSSAVLLLANPAHLTALNARKRLVLAGLVDPRVELHFSATLLTVRDGSKQSIMWHHRRWLLQRLGAKTERLCVTLRSDLCTDEDSLYPYDLPIPILSEEFAVAAKAAETYHRNYFAWNHRTRLCDALLAATHHALRERSSRCSLLIPMVTDEYSWTMRWVDLHPADFTAIQYLCHFDSCIRQLPFESLGHDVALDTPWPKGDLEQHALPLLRAFPGYESVWMYIRTVAKHSVDGLSHAAEIICAGTSRESSSEHGVKTQFLARRHLAWYHRQNLPITPRDVLLDDEKSGNIINILLSQQNS